MFTYALIMLSKSLRLIEKSRNMSGLQKLYVKKYSFNFSAFVGFIV